MDRERGYQRHPRFTKRLEVTFRSGEFTHRGILSNLSMNGLFIKTNRGFSPGTIVDIELVLPDDQISHLQGIVRRTVKTAVYLTKNGMGVELTKKDDQFLRFAESFLREHPDQEPDAPVPPPSPDEQSLPPDFQLLPCPACGVKNRVPTEKLAREPKCGKCGSPLLPDAA